MIVAATTSPPGYSLEHLPFNWFDLTLIGVLIFGLYRGRKNGMSKEFLPLLEWLIGMTTATLAYPSLADVLVNVGGMKRGTGAYVGAYLIAIGLVFFVFYFIKHSLKPKVGGSSFFGGAEYYLGMLSGVIRYACILTFALALLNAPVYSPAEIAAKRAYDKKNYGGGLYDGNYIPDVPSIQHSVFVESFLGRYIKQYGEPVLIQTVDNRTGSKPAKKVAP